MRAVVGKSKRAYAEARVVELVHPSPDRIEPRAGHPGAPGRSCRYERQLGVKQAQVNDALERIGKLAVTTRSSRSSRPSTPGATATSSSTRSAPIPPAG